MRHDFLDKWSRLDSPVHRAPAAVKLASALAVVLATVAVPVRFPWFFAAAALALVIVALLSRVPGGFLVGRLLLLEPFVGGIAVLSLFQPGGLAVATTIALRSTLSIATIVLLTSTTRFADLLLVLRQARMPALLLTTIALMYRYLFVLIEEAERMQRARTSRTLRSGRAGTWRGTATLAGQLFLRSTERAERIYAAMCAPGLAMIAAAEVRDLRYGYGDAPEALPGVSFSVGPGECVGIVGPNGAGKSTLLLHLNGILPEEPGTESSIRIDGQPITKANLPEVRRQVGLLFQDPDDQIFCPTVFEDVAFGPAQLGLGEAELARIVHAALAQVRLDGFEQRLPHHLSLGEKRRVCLAGVLACEPKMLVLDEPTAGLDPRGRRELIALLASLPATRIVASHDLDMVVALCSRVVVLDGGVVVASGPTAEVLSDEPLMLAHGLERPHSLQHTHPHGRIPG